MRYRFPILVGITLLSVVGLVWSQDDPIQDDNGDGFLDFEEGDTIYATDINDNFTYTAENFIRFEDGVTITSEGNVDLTGSVSASGFSGDGSSLTNLNADNLTTGTVGTARLGTGNADDTSFLRGDGTWVTPTTFGIAGSGSANYVPLFTDGTTVGNSAIYQSNGNVGIGTAAPTTDLQIEGSTLSEIMLHSPGGPALYVNTNLGNGAPGIYTNGGAIDIQPSGNVWLARLNGNVGIGTTAPGSKLAVAGSATIGSSYSTMVAPTNGVVIEGNVGIGTTEPGAPVEIHRNATDWTELLKLGASMDNRIFRRLGNKSTSVPGLEISFNNKRPEGSYARDNTDYGMSYIDLGGDGGIHFATEDNTPAQEWPLERMVIGSNGNVGIGTTSPGVALHVAGDIRAAGHLQSDFLNNVDNSKTIIAYASDADYVALYSGSGGEAVRIDSTGNVGIGTTAPGSKLAVSGGTTIGSSYTASVAPSNGMVIEGNVGIGTSSPASKLHLEDSTLSQIQLHHTGGPTLYVNTSQGAGGAGLNASGPLDLQPTGDVWLARQSGNVGIGTTVPEYKLDVEGEVAATSYVTTSDRRLKWDIEPLEPATAGIACLQSVTYRWIDPEMSQDRQIGLIAQDVETCFPEVVSTDSKGLKSVSYDRLVVPLIQNAQEQQVLSSAQQGQIQVQQQKISELETRLARLEILLQKR